MQVLYLAAFPECVPMMVFGREAVHRNAFSEDLHPGLAAFSSLARETRSWLLIGLLSIKFKSRVVANRSYLINPTGSSAVFMTKFICLMSN